MNSTRLLKDTEFILQARWFNDAGESCYMEFHQDTLECAIHNGGQPDMVNGEMRRVVDFVVTDSETWIACRQRCYDWIHLQQTEAGFRLHPDMARTIRSMQESVQLSRDTAIDAIIRASDHRQAKIVIGNLLDGLPYDYPWG